MAASNYPTIAVDDATVGTITWTNPGNVTAPDGVSATAAVGGATTHYIKCTGFGLNIPSMATITGIQVDIRRSTSSVNTRTATDSTVQLLKAGTAVGSNLATATPYTTGLVTEAHGGSTNLWGTTWTPSDVNNANFGVWYSVVGTGKSKTISVDFIQITVYTDANGEPGNIGHYVSTGDGMSRSEVAN